MTTSSKPEDVRVELLRWYASSPTLDPQLLQTLHKALDEIDRLGERYQKSQRRSWRRHQELRKLNKAIATEGMLCAAAHRREARALELWRQEVARNARPVDYRSVCHCWTCRLREWWRFRSGKTYPGRAGWRFPWAK